MLVSQALEKAREFELDLVEVQPNSSPPVCKIMDYGKYLYQNQKKTHPTKSKSAKGKELRLKPRIGEHDLEVKLKSAERFLADGHRVTFNMIFKGRELAHVDLGNEVLKKVIERLEAVAKIEKAPFRDGRNMKAIVSPKK